MGGYELATKRRHLQKEVLSVFLKINQDPCFEKIGHDYKNFPSRCKRVNKTNYLVRYPRNRDLSDLENNLYDPYLQKRRF